jgi:hypothetical protein
VVFEASRYLLGADTTQRHDRVDIACGVRERGQIPQEHAVIPGSATWSGGSPSGRCDRRPVLAP